jgi:hypothetical protein
VFSEKWPVKRAAKDLKQRVLRAPDGLRLAKRAGLRRRRFFWRFLVKNDTPHPLVFVSVASKGFGYDVSPLFATLAGRFISVAAKGLKARMGSGQCAVVRGEERWNVGTLVGLKVQERTCPREGGRRKRAGKDGA